MNNSQQLISAVQMSTQTVAYFNTLNKKNITKLNFSNQFNVDKITRFSEFSTNFLC